MTTPVLEPCEEWLAVPGLTRLEVSSAGNVRRWTDKNGKLLPRPRTPRFHRDRYGYLRFHFEKVAYKVHRLIALTFLGPPPSERHEVCHSNGCRTDNAVANLRWGTRSENIADAIRHGTAAMGEAIKGSKLTEDKVREMRARYAAGESMNSLAASYGVVSATINAAIHGRTWRHVPRPDDRASRPAAPAPPLPESCPGCAKVSRHPGEGYVCAFHPPAAPVPGEGPKPKPRKCNRHNDCDEADATAKSAGRPGADHCHDDCCEDCFGQ